MNAIIRPQVIGSSQSLRWLPVLRTDRDGPIDYICILGEYLLVLYESRVTLEVILYTPYKGIWDNKKECWGLETIETPIRSFSDPNDPYPKVKIYLLDAAAKIAYQWYERNVLADRIILGGMSE